MTTLRVSRLSGEAVEVDLCDAQNVLKARDHIAAALCVPPAAVTLLQGGQRLQMAQTCEQLMQAGGEVIVIVDSLEYEIAEAKNTVVKAAREGLQQILEARQQLALMEKIKKCILPSGGLPLVSTYRRYLSSLQRRLAKAALQHDEDARHAEKSVLAEIQMLEHIWAMQNQSGSQWLQEQMLQKKERIANEIKSFNLPGLVEQRYAELMKHIRFQKKEEWLAKQPPLPWEHRRTTRFLNFKDKLIDLVNTELGEDSPFIAPRHDGALYYDWDDYDPYAIEVDSEWTLDWRMDIEDARWRHLKVQAASRARQQRSCIHVPQRQRGGRFKPGSVFSNDG